MKRGFDEFFGTLANTPYYHPDAIRRFAQFRPTCKKSTTPISTRPMQYAERAVDWLGKQTKDQPWLLLRAVQRPARAAAGAAKVPRSVQEHHRTRSAARSPAMMSAMDDAVGKMLDKVRDMGEEENTLIFFFSDNGGPTQQTTSNNAPLRGFKIDDLGRRHAHSVLRPVERQAAGRQDVRESDHPARHSADGARRRRRRGRIPSGSSTA